MSKGQHAGCCPIFAETVSQELILSLHALQKLSIWLSFAGELNGKIVALGFIDVVMEVFTTHTTVEHVQHACLALVCNLALNGTYAPTVALVLV